jgi:urease accessory protein
MTDLPAAREVVTGGSVEVAGVVRLAHHARLLRRRRLVTTGGDAFLVDLPRTALVEADDAFRLEDGRLIVVEAEPEALLEARAAPQDLARLAWHVGNRHAPCELGDGWLRVPADRPMAQMLRTLGAEVIEVMAPFRPEGGAYGEGATMGHSHGTGGAVEGLGGLGHDH